MKTLKTLLTSTVAVMLLATSCVKEPLTDSTLTSNFQLVNLNASFGNPAVENGTVVSAGTPYSVNWTSLALNANSELKATHESGTEQKSTQFSYDLDFWLEGNMPPKVDSKKMFLQSGLYNNISYTLTIKETDLNSDSIPVFIKGNYILPNGEPVAFWVKVNLSETYTLADVEKQSIGAADYVLNIRFKMNGLLKGITVSDIQKMTITNVSDEDDWDSDATKAIIISKTSNKFLYDKLQENFGSCFEGELASN